MGLTAGLLFLFLGRGLFDVRESVVTPGALSGAHAQIDDCSWCHARVGQGDDATPRPLFSLVSGAMNDGCLGCHATDARTATDIHGADQGAVAAATARLQDRATGPFASPALWIAGLLGGALRGEDISCATCHSEHLGTQHRPADIDGGRCQSCHVAKLGSFSNHFEFGDFPDYRASGYFEHGMHADAIGELECSDCHELTESGASYATLGYDDTCDVCHGDEMRGSEPEPARPRTGLALNRFSHAPHLGAKCAECHLLSDVADFDFVGKAACSSCHSEDGATSTCTTCHTYHSSAFHLTPRN